jgi:hypothetical protein
VGLCVPLFPDTNPLPGGFAGGLGIGHCLISAIWGSRASAILNLERPSRQKRWFSARRVSIRPKKAYSTSAGCIETKFLRHIWNCWPGIWLFARENKYVV